MAVRKNGDRWVVEFMQRGVRVFRRLPAGRTKAEAQALESKLRTEIFYTVDLGRSPDPPLRRIIEAWSHGKDAKQKSHINAVVALLPEGATLSQLGVVRDVVVDGSGTLAPGTINRRLSVLKASARFAKKKKWADRNLSSEVELLPEPRYTRREVNPDMARKLIGAATTKRAKALIAMAAFTGMRLSEVLRFDPAKDLEGGVLRVRDQKSGGDRLVPIVAELEPYLDQFPIKAGWRNVYRGWLSARKRAGLTIRYHDLRHMAATAMAQGKHHPKTISDVLGHKSLAALESITSPSHQGVARRAKKAA